jgi:hypothetical protein
MEDTVRWTVKVSRETDTALRSYLAQRGMKKGDISKFVEEAVRWRGRLSVRAYHPHAQDIGAANMRSPKGTIPSPS